MSAVISILDLQEVPAPPAPGKRVISDWLYHELVECVREYRAECEGLGMEQTVAEIDALLRHVEVA